MAEIPVQKKSSLKWLWILLGLLLLALLLWWLLADDDEADRIANTETQVVEAGAPVTDVAALIGPNAAALAGREVRLQGVQVQNVEAGQALLVGPDGNNALLVVPEGATIPEGLAAGGMVDVMGIARPMDSLGQNQPPMASGASGNMFVAASSITVAGGEPAATGGEPAAAGVTGTPPTPETVAAANQRALERLRNDPNYTPRVYFQWDSAEVTSGAQAVLDELISSRADARTGGITLVGFADRSGPRPYNRELSERRAQEVRSYLAGKGISRDMIDVEADGETPTRVETGNDVREPLNRRVRVELSDGE